MSSAIASILSVLTLAPMGVSAAGTQAKPTGISVASKSLSAETKKRIGIAAAGTAGAAIIIGALAYAFRQKDITQMSDEQINKLSEQQAFNLLPGAWEKFWKFMGVALSMYKETDEETIWVKWEEAIGAAYKAVGGPAWIAAVSVAERVRNARKAAGEAKEVAEEAFGNAWRKGGKACNEFTIDCTPEPNDLVIPEPNNLVIPGPNNSVIQERATNLLKVLKSQIEVLKNAIKQANNRDRNRMLKSAANISDASEKYHAADAVL